LNVGFSGGEKKRLEILQMRSSSPSWQFWMNRFRIGIDALKLVAEGVTRCAILRAPML